MDPVEQRRQQYTDEEWAEIQAIVETTNLGLDGAIEMWGLSHGSPYGDTMIIGILPKD